MGNSDSVEPAVLLARPENRFQRAIVRLFFVAIVLITLLETLPSSMNGRSLDGLILAKESLSILTKRLGLWQGEWPLFAPNPVLNNAWVSADLSTPGGETIHWNSTYWATASSWQKFRHFREINYFNRMPFRDSPVANDFADYVARQELGNNFQALDFLPDTDVRQPLWTLELNRNELNMSSPAEGPLPTRDETVWIVTSLWLATRRYEP